MFGDRQLPHAKYELLIENKRVGLTYSGAFKATGIIIAVVLITSLTVYIARESLKSLDDRRFVKELQKLNINNDDDINITGSVGWLQRRTELYGLALKQYLHSNQSDAVSTAPSVTTNKPPSNGIKTKTLRLVCYYALPSSEAGGDLMPEQINPSLCTHINIAFARITNGSLQPANSTVLGLYTRVVALKSSNPSLKVLLSIGGSSEPGSFSTMTETHASRKLFIKDILALVAQCKLDGLDFDWEFPAWYSDKMERVHFTQLLMELRMELSRRHSTLLLSVAVAAPQPIIDAAYDIAQMAEYVDYVNVMAYDYHFYVGYLPMTGFNAPLYKEADDSGYFATLNTNWTVYYWQSKGMPKEKIIVGLPTYGHSFTLVNNANHGVSAPASGFGVVGDMGFVSYPQACQFVEAEAATVFDRDSRVPYAFKNSEWISYDDERSLAYKAEYVASGGYGGAMIWSLNLDDFKGECSNTEQNWFPLTTKVKNVLEDDQL